MAQQRSWKDPRVKVSLWHMVRDVLIHSMNKGQFLVALFGLIIIILILKMPNEMIASFISSMFKTKYSWVIIIVETIAWIIHSKWHIKSYKKEIDRLAKLRDQYQEKLGCNAESSEE